MLAKAASALVFLLLVAALVRVPGLDNPPSDIHHVRQSDTASIARNMAREGIDLLHPRIDWAGPDAGTVESELPLYNALVGLAWRRTGSGNGPWFVPRLTSVVAWLLGGLALAVWVRRRLDGPAAAYLLLYALSPLAIAFSRNVQPDALSVALLLWSLERADSASDRRGGAAWGAAIFAGLLGGLAVATKGTVAPLALGAGLLLLVRKDGLGRHGAAAVLVPLLLIPGAWYWHAHVHLGAEGASFGLWGDDAHKWGALGIWTNTETWRSIGGTAVMHAATPAGLALAAIGARQAIAVRELRPFVGAVIACAFTVLAVTEGFRLHSYYQLAFVPFLSVLAGAGILKLTAGARGGFGWERASVGGTVAGILLLWSVLAGRGFVVEAVQRDLRVERAGAAIAELVPEGRSVVVVDRHPQSILFAADRRGFHRTYLDMGQLAVLEEAGADFLFVSSTSRSYAITELIEPLMVRRPQVHRAEGWYLFDLGPSVPVPAPSPTGTAPEGGTATVR